MMSKISVIESEINVASTDSFASLFTFEADECLLRKRDARRGGHVFFARDANSVTQWASQGILSQCVANLPSRF